MAARFWRWVLGCELLIAAAVAFWWATGRDQSAGAAALMTLAALAALQFLFVAASFVFAQASSRESRLADAAYVLRALLTEPVQFLLAQLAMSAEPWLRLRAVPAPPSGRGAQPVLLIHGILCNRGIWARAHERLRAAGFAPIGALNLEPPGSDIESYGVNVEQELRTLQRESRGAPVAIVAHSMGGLVARSLLRTVGRDLISRIVTVASPHHGTVMARCLPLAGAQQMRPGASWLLTLNAAQEGRLPVPVTSIYSREDSLVAPARSATLKGAQVHELRGLGHFGLLRSRRGLDCIISALERHRDS